jgi:23S rRNA (guanosine2251-2'-O)-methyltransferase
MTKYNSKELRKMEPVEQEIVELKRNPIYFVLDEVLDTYNIGSMFRLGDAVGVEKIYLCGDMEYPPSSRIHKSAVGTENWVPWEKRDSSVEVIKRLRKEGIFTIAVEQDTRAISYQLLATKIQFPCAIIVGHESDGIKKEVLDEVDVIVELPMFGINKSANVWGTAAVISYKILESLEN